MESAVSLALKEYAFSYPSTVMSLTIATGRPVKVYSFSATVIGAVEAAVS